MNYTKSEELIGKILKKGDTLCLAGINYMVDSNCLRNLDNVDDGQIFKVIGIKNKFAFCRSAYRTVSMIGDFPISVTDDFFALKRVAIALMKAYEQKIKRNSLVPKELACACV